MGTAQKAPIPSQYGTGALLILAGRDAGAGVFAAYAADFSPTTHVRLLRYGGGSVAVGSVKGLHAAVSSVATSVDGRIWVTWAGEINGHGVTAFTRSNKAVTRFEPIQTARFTWARARRPTRRGRRSSRSADRRATTSRSPSAIPATAA